MEIVKTNIGNNIELNSLKDAVNEYTEIVNIRTVRAKEIESYLKDNPTHYVFDGYNVFLTNICNHVCQVETSRTIDPKGFKLTPENAEQEWAVLEPVSFIHAIRAWDCGAHILKRSDDLLPCITYIQDGKLGRDDLNFDVLDVLVYSWFKYIRK